MEGIFISIEGGEGSGKTTVINILKEKLKDYPVIFTREPGGTPISEKIREIILAPENSQMSPETEALLYAASRAQHMEEKIIPALEQGKIVITDRFVHSSYAYQCGARGLSHVGVMSINTFATKNIMPEIVFFLDVPPKVAFERIKNREKDRLEREGLEFHEKVYNSFRRMEENENTFWALDGTKKPEVLAKEMLRVILAYYSFKNNIYYSDDYVKFCAKLK